MSKSLGNFITIRDVLNSDLATFLHLEKNETTRIEREKWTGLAARFSMLQTLYREPINWTMQRLEESSDELLRWYRYLREEGFVLSGELDQVSELVEALADDINTWAAITVLRKAYRQKNTALLGQGLALLGLFDPLFMAENAALFAEIQPDQLAGIEAKINERLQLIKAKNWAEADRIRDALLAEGIQLKDGKDPVTGERVTTWEMVR